MALTLAKSSLAEERGVQLRVADDCHVDADLTDITAVLTVTGNLIDNAIEATAQAPGPRWVELTVVSAGENLMIRVRDSGPGVPDDMREAIFTDGFTSKSSTDGRAARARAWRWSGRSPSGAAAWSASGGTAARCSPRCCPAASTWPREPESGPDADPLARPAATPHAAGWAAP